MGQNFCGFVNIEYKINSCVLFFKITKSTIILTNENFVLNYDDMMTIEESRPPINDTPKGIKGSGSPRVPIISRFHRIRCYGYTYVRCYILWTS